ncbi:MAG: iron ABC transporter permease [Acetobacteraceae bacterium]|nr:iron ABC transporter permease [Acetobacteraceae bacterium]
MSRSGLILALGGLVAALFVVSLAVGPVVIPLRPALTDVLGGRDSAGAMILRDLRLPRTLLGVLVGGSLGLCGAAMQGVLRNPLAEPGVLGVSGCAALGAVIAFYSGLSAALPLALPLGGMIGALLAVLLLYALTGSGAGLLTVLLAGAALNSLAGALVALALNLAPSPFALYEILFWLMGSLTDRSMAHVLLALPGIAIGAALLLSSRRALDALSLGEDVAQSLGFALGRVRLRLVLGTALAVGATVAVAGAIGFVGLVVPHLVRPLAGGRPGAVLVPAALAGAALLLLADIGTRLLPTGPELKLGVLTSLVGAPFFILLVLRMREDEA